MALLDHFRDVWTRDARQPYQTAMQRLPPGAATSQPNAAGAEETMLVAEVVAAAARVKWRLRNVG